MYGGGSYGSFTYAGFSGFASITATVSATLTTSGTISGAVVISASATATLSPSSTITGAVSLSASVVSTLAFIGVIDGTLDAFHPQAYVVVATRTKYTVTATTRTKYTVSFEVRTKYTITITEVRPVAKDIGDVIEILFTIKHTADDVAADPTPLVVTVRTPSGIETSFTYGTSAELTKVSAGSYMFSYQPTESGVHDGWIQGAGAAIVADPFDFRVNVKRVGV